MLEQEIASLMHFIILEAGNPTPYYDSVPEDFFVPAVYFPQPKISTRGDTASTYVFGYEWYVNFFHVDDPSALALGRMVLSALCRNRLLVSMIDMHGNPMESGIRLNNPSLDLLEKRNASQLSLSWDSHRPYNVEEYQKAMDIVINLYAKEGIA